jgi:AcrR family transcriptional regulator
MTKREERKNQIRKRIITACLSLMGQKNFQLITMKEVCEEANVARKTLYSYFPSKEDMLDEVSRSVMFDTSISSFTNALKNHQGTKERLDEAFLNVSAPTDEYSEHIEIFIQLIQNLTMRMTVSSAQLTVLHQAVYDFFKACLDNSDTKDGLDVQIISDLTVNTMIGIVLSWVNNQNYPARERFNDLKKHLAKMILLD